MRNSQVSWALVLPAALIFTVLPAFAQSLRISEFVADNTVEVLEDEDGDPSDWIEVFNPGTSAVSLAGYFLSDDEMAPGTWAFPARQIGGGEYLIVFASDKDRSPVAGVLHTNFKLSAGGEALLLSRDTGGGSFETLSSFAPEYPRQREGISYGFRQDGTTGGFFETPTPGAANGVNFLGFVGDTSFSVDRGFHSAPFDLEITTATPGATIRYTTDGSEPTADTGTVYSGPVAISGTTTLRAAAFLSGFRPTDTDTQTYLFLSDIRTQFADGGTPAGWPDAPVNQQEYDYGMDSAITDTLTAEEMDAGLTAIPSMCITISQDDFSDASRGIYSNPRMRGRNWERPGSLELIDPTGKPGFQVGCGFRVRGGASRNPTNPKHAFRVFFRSEYGAGSLDYPLFGVEGATSFEKIDLRTAQNYSWAFAGDAQNTFLREVFGRDLQREMGRPYTKSRYYHLYINSVYWGLYMTQERAEADFGATYLGGDADSFDTIKSAGSSEGYVTEATDGFLASIPQEGGGEIDSDWKKLWDLHRAQVADPTLARYYELQGLNPEGERDPLLPVLLDVDNLIDYMMIIGYTGNYDAPLSDFIGSQGTNNWYATRDRDRDDRGFAFFIHDGEHSLGAGGQWKNANDRMNTTNSAQFRSDFTRSNPAFVHFDLAESTEEYRVRFADRVQAHLFNGGILTEERAEALFGTRREIVDKVIDIEAARWGDSKRPADPLDRVDWARAVRRVEQLIGSRDSSFLLHLKRAGLYPDTDAPGIVPFGGLLPENGKVILSGTEGALFYTKDGSDPRLVGGAVSPEAIGVVSGSEITLGCAARVQVRALLGGEWSAMVCADFTNGVPATEANLIVSEINYNPAPRTGVERDNPLVGGSADFEFIEIANVSDETVDLSGVKISRVDVGGKLEGVDDPLATGTLVGPGARVVVVADRAAFGVRYPLVPESLIVGDYSGRLGNGGDTVLLLAADGAQIARVRYGDELPWPEGADGTGASLDLKTVSAGQDISVAGSWEASAVAGGSPGTSGNGTPFVGDPEADLDGDGVPALLEFVYGSSDSVAGDAPALQVSPSGIADGELDVVVTRSKNAGDIIVTLEISDDLSGWAAASTTTTVIGRTGLAGGLSVAETHRVCLPPSDPAGTGFIRVRAVATR